MIMVVCTVILAFGRLRKEDSYKLEASLGYMVTLCLKPLQKISILEKPSLEPAASPGCFHLFICWGPLRYLNV